jgi:hypothetical protein
MVDMPVELAECIAIRADRFRIVRRRGFII